MRQAPLNPNNVRIHEGSYGWQVWVRTSYGQGATFFPIGPDDHKTEKDAAKYATGQLRGRLL